MSAMDTLLINFKKDGPERNTSAYLQKRLSTLEGYWNEFQTNHTRLCAEYEDPNHKYFSENYYQRAIAFYNEVKNHIMKYVTTEPTNPLLKPTRPEPPTTPTTLNVSQTMFSAKSTSQRHPSRVEEMLRKQKSNFKAFSRTAATLDLEGLSERWEYEDAMKRISVDNDRSASLGD
ncbi:unnamed protein product [Euphydryas editha]|uniref:Uncharacterized protein n=1 Tax=Euphydryas editha TaxID=104508 RepID=A0AAU9UG37_EUPED|nr:unnamed protein product [Euphydryas editha]